MLDSNRTKAHFNWHQKRRLRGKEFCFTFCRWKSRILSYYSVWDVLLILFCDHFDRLESFFTRILCLNLQRHSQFFMVLFLSARLRVQSASSPPFFLRDSRARETRARRKITHARKGDFSRGVIFTRAPVSLALLPLRKNGGQLIVYLSACRKTSVDFYS